MASVLPGDVVVVRTGGIGGELIRLGEMLEGEPDLRNHVAVVHHLADGVVWFIEGRPGGVGWHPEPASGGEYLSSKWTVTNAAQPKSEQQRHVVCDAMRHLLRAPYDWGAIGADTMAALRLPEEWARFGAWGGRMPGHVVCSSSTAWAYGQAQLARPYPAVLRPGETGNPARYVMPSDWDDFIMRQAWARAA